MTDKAPTAHERRSAEAHKRRMKRGRMGPPDMIEKKRKAPLPDTQAVRDNVDLRCFHCDRIFNGPNMGETVKLGSKKYSRINEEDRIRAGGNSGGISDGVCSRRSCIDASAEVAAESMRPTFPDRDWEAYKDSYRKSMYEEARNDTDRYPEGFIDDVEPPL